MGCELCECVMSTGLWGPGGRSTTPLTRGRGARSRVVRHLGARSSRERPPICVRGCKNFSRQMILKLSLQTRSARKSAGRASGDPTDPVADCHAWGAAELPCGADAPGSKERRPVGLCIINAAQAADRPRRFEAWGSPRQALALQAPSGAPAGRSLCLLLRRRSAPGRLSDAIPGRCTLWPGGRPRNRLPRKDVNGRPVPHPARHQRLRTSLVFLDYNAAQDDDQTGGVDAA